MKKLFAILVKVGLSLLLIIAVLNLWVIGQTSSAIYDDIGEVPDGKLALVLGTSKYRVGGGINPYFQTRMEAAAALFEAGKVKHILVSGDNSTAYYNEPKRMKEELVRLGVPEEHITLDDAGLRTLDSIVRCKEVFGQEQFIIVTQQFHSYRALFISQYYDLDTSGFIAKDAPDKNSPTLLIREFFARPLAVLDLFVLGTRPGDMGAPEDIHI